MRDETDEPSGLDSSLILHPSSLQELIMLQRFSMTLFVLMIGLLSARAKPVTKPIKLFNGKDLANFYTYLRGHGKNKDPENVFTVKDGAIRVSGEIFGCFTTQKEYENYHLVVEFKWGTQTWKPREKRAMDSGILLHCVGEDGAAGGVW